MQGKYEIILAEMERNQLYKPYVRRKSNTLMTIRSEGDINLNKDVNKDVTEGGKRKSKPTAIP